MASSIWVSLDYTSQLRGADWNSGPLHPTKPSPPCPKTIRWRAKHGRAKSSRAHIFHRNVRSELSLLSRMVEQDLSSRRLYAESFAGRRSWTNDDPRHLRWFGCRSCPRAAKKTPAQKRRVSPNHTGRGDRSLCRLERRKSVRSSESLRGNRQERWPQHPLNRTVAGFNRAKIKGKSKNQARRGERDFDSNGVYAFPKTTGIKQSKTRRWKCFWNARRRASFLRSRASNRLCAEPHARLILWLLQARVTDWESVA